MKKKSLNQRYTRINLTKHKHSLPFYPHLKLSFPGSVPRPANLVSKVNTAEGELDFQCQALLTTVSRGRTTFPSVFPFQGTDTCPTLTGGVGESHRYSSSCWDLGWDICMLVV